MNRGELRTRVLSLRSRQADNDTAFHAEVNTACIDVALKRLASEVPEALIPDTESIRVLQDMTDSSLVRTLAATADEYVLSLGSSASGSDIKTDGSWDGILHLEVTYLDRVYRFQCREFWSASSIYYVSLDRPWIHASATGMAFRLYLAYLSTRDDVTKVVDGRLFGTSQRRLVSILPAGFVRATFGEDFQGRSTGPPSALSRWKHFQLDAPNRTPAVAALQSAWTLTQEAPGTFTYRYTYVWGKRPEADQSPGSNYDPTWESAPSPESAAITTTAFGIEVSGLTNIDWQLNFDPDPATLRNGRSGIRKRIYRARTAVTARGTTESNVESPGIYYFLAEVEGVTLTYTDDGTAIPDYHRRLPESHGYWLWALDPRPDGNYDLDLRVNRRPKKLEVDSDTPQVHPDFEDMLLLLTLHYLALLDKDPAEAADYENKFKERVNQWRSREANPADYVPPTPWAPEPIAGPIFYGPYSSS